MKTGSELIAEERVRQINEEGWTKEHDAEQVNGELAMAAACYATPNCLKDVIPFVWPWNIKWWKPTPDDRIRELTKAGALISAEIDRLQAVEEDES